MKPLSSAVSQYYHEFSLTSSNAPLHCILKGRPQRGETRPALLKPFQTCLLWGGDERVRGEVCVHNPFCCMSIYCLKRAVFPINVESTVRG